MTTEKTTLIEDAARAGYSVEPQKDGTTIAIVKRVGRWKKLSGLMLYNDGTAIRLDVDLSVALAIRSVKAMRNILGI